MRALQITRHNPVVFSPDDIAGLRLWLSADQQVFTDSLGTIAAVNDGDVIGCWKDLSGNSYNVVQAVSSQKKPLLKLAANGINNRPTVLFDGVDDILINSTADWLIGDRRGTLAIAFQLPTLTGNEVLLASADYGSGLYYIQFCCPYDTSTAKFPHINEKNNDTVDAIRANTTVIAAATTYVVVFASSDTAYWFRTNNADQAITVITGLNNGHWFQSVINRDNFTIGGLRYNTTESLFINAKISEIVLYDCELSSTELASIEAYLNRRFGAWV